MTAPSQSLIDQLLEAAEGARQATREAREAQKDLRRATKEAKEIIDKYVDEHLRELVRKDWQESMDSINLTELGAGLKKSFSDWVDLLEEASKTLESLSERDAELEKEIILSRAARRV